MTTNFLATRCPGIGAGLPALDLVTEPTPLTRETINIDGAPAAIWVKHDETSGALYGGNKVRKLAYILAKAEARRVQAVATFGAVGSHHALATALYARALGFDAICFLGHQSSLGHVEEALSAHAAIGSRIVRYGGDRRRRIATLREILPQQRTWIVPAGGSSWLGAVGFIDAALELAADFEARGTALPRRLYVANGTMGTVAGLGLGLALAGVDVEVQAVRITSETIANRAATEALMRKTALMLNRIDPSFPAQLADRAKVRYRDEFVGDGYTKPTPASDRALRLAEEQLGLTLESTYTAKAFAALLADARDAAVQREGQVFWNTYNAVELPRKVGFTFEDTGLPREFERYCAAAAGGSSGVSS